MTGPDPPAIAVSVTVQGSPSDTIRRRIDLDLRAIEERHGVRILFAIESGSRAWGFPSPDSDYDVRFVYAHPYAWYLSLGQRRDVIERPITGDLDIAGWDLRKAMGLLLKPNPVLLEWLDSPIRYRWRSEPTMALADLSGTVAHHRACWHHYRRLATRHRSTYVDGRDRVPVKKYFYLLRPVLALRWMRLIPGTPPPMRFQDLMAGTDLPSPVIDRLHRLVALKARTRELGEEPHDPVFDALVEAELTHADRPPASVAPRPATTIDDANALFRDLLAAVWR